MTSSFHFQLYLFIFVSSFSSNYISIPISMLIDILKMERSYNILIFEALSYAIVWNFSINLPLILNKIFYNIFIEISVVGFYRLSELLQINGLAVCKYVNQGLAQILSTFYWMFRDDVYFLFDSITMLNIINGVNKGKG